MTGSTLTLRINRRAIGAVVIGDTSLECFDGRHLTSHAHKGVDAAVRFVGYLLTFTKASTVVIDAPATTTDTTTAQIISALQAVVAEKGSTWLRVEKGHILAAYAVNGIKSRQELRTLVRHYWPELATLRGRVEPYVVDAAAAALYAECRLALERTVA